ncbi:radical SAM protein [Anabaena subtropica]|uniref:Radical SAM protein n=1 Tax=Anabaena subtropica FACHB-260 TaxID=2692884 RepID=A0ABR8CLX0_9NOST|nr:radical SAM protein [Anabaena subtropica]MBD2343152.1 radical SAM protein [Anabaena subtropica FACHB-260]
MSAIQSTKSSRCSSVYGPVKSWRFGNSLGIDPIGDVCTCSFNCVYCQLGQIQAHTTQRQIFVPTTQFFEDLQGFAPYDQVDVVTLSGSGEPTLALNLEEILAIAKQITQRPTVVLTNSTSLRDTTVRHALKSADTVAVKLDAISSNQLQRINQPVATISLPHILAGIEQFRGEYPGNLAIQTMVLSPWTTEMVELYIQHIQRLHPDEIQLNVPTRSRVLVRQLDARGNNPIESVPHAMRQLKRISVDILKALADTIHYATKIPVRCAPIN